MKRGVFCFLVFVFYFLNAAHSEEPLTLSKAYALALKRSEDLAMKSWEIEAAQGHFYQALSVVLPSVNYVITRSKQDVSKEPSQSSSGSDGASSSSLRRTTPQAKFVFSQPIFSGFKEIAAIQAAGVEKSLKTHELQRARELLWMDVTDSFYTLMQAYEDLGVLELGRQALEDRMKELESRVKIGRSRESELERSKANLKSAQASLVKARRLETVARELLEFYTGMEVTGELQDDFWDRGQSFHSDITDDDQNVRIKGLTSRRSDVKAAEDAYTLAEKEVVVAQSDLFPTVTLDGNYYTKRVGFQKDIDWDVLLTVDIPIFEGATTYGNIKEAQASREIARETVSKTKRIAELEAKSAEAEWRSSIEEETALREAVEALKKSYESQVLEYRSNLVSNLEVLDAQKEYQDKSLEWNAAHFGMRKNFWKFRVAIGNLES